MSDETRAALEMALLSDCHITADLPIPCYDIVHRSARAHLASERSEAVAALERVWEVVTARATPPYPGPEAHEALWCAREDEIRLAIGVELAALAPEGKP